MLKEAVHVAKAKVGLEASACGRKGWLPRYLLLHPQTSTLPGLPFFVALLAEGDSVRIPRFHEVPSAQILGSSVFLPTWISLWAERRPKVGPK